MNIETVAPAEDGFGRADLLKRSRRMRRKERNIQPARKVQKSRWAGGAWEWSSSRRARNCEWESWDSCSRMDRRPGERMGPERVPGVGQPQTQVFRDSADHPLTQSPTPTAPQYVPNTNQLVSKCLYAPDPKNDPIPSTSFRCGDCSTASPDVDHKMPSTNY